MMMRPHFKQECQVQELQVFFLFYTVFFTNYQHCCESFTNTDLLIPNIQPAASSLFSNICRTFIKEKKLMKTQIFPDIDDITFSEKSDKTGN